MTRKMITKMIHRDSILPRIGYRECVEDHSLEELVASLERRGQLYPILVAPEGELFRILTGMRVFRGSQVLGWSEVWCAIVGQQLNAAERLQLALASDLHRKSLSPVERAGHVETLMKLMNCNAAEVAEMLDYSAASVSRWRTIGTLPDDVKSRIGKGLSGKAAYESAQKLKRQQAVYSNGPGNAASGVDGEANASGPSSSKRRGRKPIPRIELDRGNGNSITLQGPDFQSLEAVVAALGETLDVMTEALAAGLDRATFREAFKGGRQAG
jgi:ParB/RepB/Spo0J family partition protein